ncbi:glycoside hydrolase superfamily [Paraphysoderma sedebokerense]|nr:glycoside hydrolase superfamily [Paraphysoderma sedebokerense]
MLSYFAILLLFTTCLGEVASQQFVQTNNVEFKLNGKPFFFQGTNLHHLGFLTGPSSEQDIAETFKKHSQNGINVLRMWAYNNHNGNDDRYLLRKQNDGQWILGDAAWKRMDFVLNEAKNAGVKVILTFGNFEEDYGGIKWLVENILGSGKDKELFYTDNAVQERYKWYVQQVINRKNSISGITYKDDPTIFAWEILNEPHTSNGWERSKGIEPGSTVNKWICEFSSWLKPLVPNHLVSSGEEGYRTRGLNGTYHDWTENGLKGVDFAANAKCKNIDFMTIHLYPDNWKIPFSSQREFIDQFLFDRKSLAHAQNKPIIIEEVGCCMLDKSPDYSGKRTEVLRAAFDSVYKHAYAGVIVWQALAINTQRQDRNYDIDIYGQDKSTGGDLILENAKKMNGKNN